MPLAAFAARSLTFTYYDSMFSFAERQRQPELAQVFTRDEIAAVIAQYGMPGHSADAGDGLARKNFVEVQVWDDSSIRDFLRAGQA
jgi:hypothetical protein